MSNADIPKVLGEYRNPTHQAFEERTAWSLFNAFTQVGKGWNPFALPKRTQRLHGLMDMAVEALGPGNGDRAALPPIPPPFPTAPIVGGRDADFEEVS